MKKFLLTACFVMAIPVSIVLGLTFLLIVYSEVATVLYEVLFEDPEEYKWPT